MSRNEAFPDPKVQALVQAALAEDAPKAKALVTAGADPNYVGKDGILPLVWVVAKSGNDLMPVKVLLEAGADPNKKFTGRNPPSEDSVMYLAAGGDKPDLLELLLQHGGDVNIRGSKDETALIVATQEGRDENIKTLLEHGADINAHDANRKGAPESAMTYGRFDLVALFLEKGYSNDLTHLGTWVEARIVGPGDQCAWKKKVMNTLRDKGVKFPTMEPAEIHDPCMPDWYPQKH